MFRFFLRSLWRLIILAIGIGLIFLTYKFYPFPDSNLAITAFVLVAYCAFAYIVIPALFRLLQIFVKPNRIPLYVTTRDGWPSDPVNIAIIANSRHHLESSMNKAGWYTADPLTIRDGFRELISIVFNRSYPQAPLSNLFLFNRPHDIGFEIPTNDAGSARTRHHVRFWRLEEPLVDDNNIAHYTFWAHKLRHLFHAEKELWIGAATEETHPIDIQWRTGQLTHGGSHDSDRERDFIIESLRSHHQTKAVHTSDAGETLKFRGQQFRTFYISDGSIKIVRLK